MFQKYTENTRLAESADTVTQSWLLLRKIKPQISTHCLRCPRLSPGPVVLMIYCSQLVAVAERVRPSVPTQPLSPPSASGERSRKFKDRVGTLASVWLLPRLVLPLESWAPFSGTESLP